VELERHSVLPGFTASSSLHQRVGQYTSHVGPAAGQAAVQAQLLWPRGPGGCIPGCICVTFDNCPCCKSIFDIFAGPTRINSSWS
jgi:hypothetical protein